MHAALHAGIPYADINDEAEVLWELFEARTLDAEARQRGLPLVVGLGSSPGLTNIWARYLADQMDTVSAFHIAIAMNPSYRSPAVFRHRFSTHGGGACVCTSDVRHKRTASFRGAPTRSGWTGPAQGETGVCA
jgi:saccharopine dehydrogenase-like NADP-dependent oxidoreductase